MTTAAPLVHTLGTSPAPSHAHIHAPSPVPHPTFTPPHTPEPTPAPWLTFEWPAARTVVVTVLVTAAHALALWLLHTGLLSATLQTESAASAAFVIELAAPITEPQTSPPAAAAPTPAAPTPAPQPQPKPTTPRPEVAPLPVTAEPAPVLAQPAVTAPSKTAEPSAAAPAAPSSAPASNTNNSSASSRTSEAAPASIQLPSSDADYLNNPRPAYPAISKRQNEQGTVVVRVLINTEGRAEQAELRTSSGYPRLDRTALDTVRNWRYVPGKRNGVPTTMWFNVPIKFELE